MLKTIDNDLKPLFISFSGGETSGDMLLRLWEKWNGKRKIIVLFANTGQEDDRTLKFVHMVETHYNIPVIWIEAVINPIYGKGITHKVVNYYTAARNNQTDTPMEKAIEKMGIPNGKLKYCTRDLKERPMLHYLKSIGVSDFYTAVGIRKDEGADRLTSKTLFYEPFLSGITKPMVNEAWQRRPFRLAKSERTDCVGLDLPGYAGNCRWCHKKTLRKHLTLIKENPEIYDFPEKMEAKFENYMPPERMEFLRKKNKTWHFPIRFFRENKSVAELKKMAETFTDVIIDDTQIFNDDFLDKVNGDCFESCEPFK